MTTSRKLLEESHPAKREQILVFSLDFDGCIFHPQYTPDRLIESNQLLINHLLAQINQGQFDQVILMVGSNRQSYYCDLVNSASKGSCFPALIKLRDELRSKIKIPCHVDKYLLADTYGGQKIGDNFRNAKKGNTNFDFAEIVWDEYKESLLYAQMHKVASDYPLADIVYQFYDDRTDVLGISSSFFNEEKLFVPHNVKNCYYQYNGTLLRKFDFDNSNPDNKNIINGLGVIDTYFQRNIIRMAKVCHTDIVTSRMSNGGISDRLYGETLKNFKNKRLLKPKDICYELLYEIKNIKPKLPKDFSQTDIQSLENALIDLHRKILTEVLQLEKQNLPLEQILQSKAIIIAKHTLKMIRDFLDEGFILENRFLEVSKYIDYYDSFNYKFITLFKNQEGNILEKSKKVAQELRPFFANCNKQSCVLM